MEVSAGKLAELVGGTVDGDVNVVINGFAKIEEAKKGCLTFLANPLYTHYIYTTEASVVLVKKDFVPEHTIKATLVRVEDPYATLAMLLNYVSSLKVRKQGVEHPSFINEGVLLPDDVYVGAFAYIGNNVKIGRSVSIYPQCYVGDNVTIGDNTIIYAGAKIYHDCVIGNNCIIHAGVVIGSDGFGFAPEKGEYMKISQIGNVVIHDDVEIGANTTIDRATMGSTVIRKGVKLDNLIQIAHNVEIGENTVMAAQVGVAGSAKIGSHNMVGGQVGFAGHIKVGNNNRFGAQSGIPNSIGDNCSVIGSPVINAMDFARQTVYLKRLGSLFKDVASIKKSLAEMKEQ